MAAIPWDNRKTARLLPPSEEEALAIEKFADDPKAAARFQDELATSIRQVGKDITAVPQVARGLFDRTDNALEASVQLQSKAFEPWSPLSLQPRLLARSVPNIPAMTTFIDDNFTKVAGPENDNEIGEILKAAFLDEISIVQQSELVPSPSELIRLAESHKAGPHHAPAWWSGGASADGPLRKLISFADSSSKYAMKLLADFQKGKNVANISLIAFSANDHAGRLKYYLCAIDTSDRRVVSALNHIKTFEELAALCQVIASVDAEILRNARRDTLEQSKFSYCRQSFALDNTKMWDIGHNYVNLGETRRSNLIHRTFYFRSGLHKSPTTDLTIETAKTLPIEERLDLLDRIAISHPGQPISPAVRLLIPETGVTPQALPPETLQSYERAIAIAPSDRQITADPKGSKGEVPAGAPIGHANAQIEAGAEPNAAMPTARWDTDRQPGDNPLTFVQRHYGSWRDGVWQPDGLTRLDLRHADYKLYNALAQHNRRHPNDRLELPGQTEAVESWVKRVQDGDEPAPTDAKGAMRFAAALRRNAARDGR